MFKKEKTLLLNCIRLSVFVLSIFLVNPLFCDIYGKISGRVTKESGGPIEGVAVEIQELEIGTYTDKNGEFYFVKLKPGIYNLVFSHVGYETLELKRVLVESGRTSFIDVKLKESPIPLEPVVVTAKEEPIPRDRTWTHSRFKGDDIYNLPVENAQDVIRLSGGVTEDKFGNIHLRGGRSDELVYAIDGIPIVGPLTEEPLSIMDKLNIKETSLITGIYPSEYGNALSGIVNVITPDPHLPLQLRFETYSSPLYLFRDYKQRFRLGLRSRYQFKDWYEPLNDVHRDNENVSLYEYPEKTSKYPTKFSIGGNLRKKNLSYFLSYTNSSKNMYLPFGYEFNESYFGKFCYTFRNSKLTLGFEDGTRKTKDYNHAWKYNPEGYPETVLGFKRFFFSLTYPFGRNTFLDIVLSKMEEDEKTSVSGKHYTQYQQPRRDQENEFYLGGDYPNYKESFSKTNFLKGTLTWFGKGVEIKTGIEAFDYYLKFFEWAKLYVIGFLGDPQIDNFERRPYEYSLFGQTKVESESFVLNAGLRYDEFNPKSYMWKDKRDPYSPLEKVKPKRKVSPRIGISFPATERVLFYFSYGHFFQRPPFKALYTHPSYLNPDSLPSQLGIVGNPDLEPMRSVAYESGLNLMIARNLIFGIGIYGRDIKGLLTTREVRRYPYIYYIFDNQDFATIRGVDINLLYKNQIINLKLGYTFQIARGNRSYPLQGFYNAYTGQVEVMREFYLDYDRRHTINSLMWINFLGLNMGIIYEGASGLPYTPFISLGVEPEINSARMPWTHRVDFSGEKTVKFRRAKISLILEVKNLLDNLNILNVHTDTGDPFYASRTSVGFQTLDFMRNPSNVDEPRTIRFGLRCTYD